MIARRGFALLTVLFTISLIGGLSAAVTASANRAIRSAQNRVAWERAYWRAYGCASRMHAAANAALDTINATRRLDAWRRLNEMASTSPALKGCDTTLEAAGTRIDVNSAPSEVLEHVVDAIGTSASATDLVEFVVSSRDSVPIVDVREVASRMRAELPPDSTLHLLEQLLSVDRGRISLATAPASVLAMVPGFTPEAAEALVTKRGSTGAIADLSELLPLLSSAARSELIARYPDAQRVTTTEPDAWTIRSVATDGVRTVPVELRWRLVRRAGNIEVADGRVVR